MATATTWISRRPHADGLEACVRDTNINVWGLVERRLAGLSDDEILATYQGLTKDDLDVAWAYYAEHPKEIERAIRLNAEA